MKRHPFNLVEILLALGVIMIGVVSLSGLFPIASKVSSDANMETYVANALEEFAAFIRVQATKSNTEWGRWINNGGNSFIPGAEPFATLDKDEAIHIQLLGFQAPGNVGDWSAIDVDNPLIFRNTQNTHRGVFQLLCIHGQMPAQGNTLNLADLDSTWFIDSRVLITVWREQITQRFDNHTPQHMYGFDEAARIIIKATWPAERPEAVATFDNSHNIDSLTPARQIRVMTFDLFNPN